MPAYDQTIIILLLESLLFLLIIGVLLARADLQEGAGATLIFYTTLSCLGALYEIAWRMDWFDSRNVPPIFIERLSMYGAVFLALLFLQLSRTFLRLSGPGWRWWTFGLVCLAAIAVLDANLPVLADPVWRGDGWQVSRSELTFGLFVLSWSVFVVVAAGLTFLTHRRAQQPLHRNRIKYWLPALIAIAVGDLLLFIGRPALGVNFHLLGILIAVYAALTHRLPDVRQFARRTLSYLLVTFLTVGIYLAGFIAMQYLFQTMPGYNPLLAGAVVALVLVVLFQPLLAVVRRGVNWLIFGKGYDPTQTLSEFSASISNVLDLERLTAVIFGLIHEAFEIRGGILFTVHKETNQPGVTMFHLRGIRGMGEGDAPLGSLSAKNPVTVYLRRQRRPLTQYDIDLLPQFKHISEAEHTWLSGLGMDVYVPIYAKGIWIGLLALGPKCSRDRYFDHDLTMLNTLADQTAVALENARLVEDLKTLNEDLTTAYSELDLANHQLQELDKLKSAFIGVITHELRTPFANIIFALELFERQGRQHLPHDLHSQLDQLATGINTAKTMVDNLVTFATFLSKQGQLRPVLLDFNQVIRDSVAPLKTLAEAKRIELHLDLPVAFPPLAGDQDRLAEAVYHLVHNAIKFTEPGGEVWVRSEASADGATFEVQDTGMGIPAQDLPTLWDGFTQMADPLLRGVEGLGLGLALVKYIVTAHRGEVWVRSQAGAGSTFGFQLPSYAGDTAPAAAVVQFELLGVADPPDSLLVNLPVPQLAITG